MDILTEDVEEIPPELLEPLPTKFGPSHKSTGYSGEGFPWVHSPNKTGRLRTGAAHCRDQSGSASVSFSRRNPLTPDLSALLADRLSKTAHARLSTSATPDPAVARIDVGEGDGCGGNGQGKST